VPVVPVAQVLRADDGRWVLAGQLTIDSAGVAVLLEWKRRAVAEGVDLAFENVPPTMASLAELYGVDGLLSPA
jgi:ABC-type transporter Mla MlaB component